MVFYFGFKVEPCVPIVVFTFDDNLLSVELDVVLFAEDLDCDFVGVLVDILVLMILVKNDAFEQLFEQGYVVLVGGFVGHESDQVQTEVIDLQIVVNLFQLNLSVL